MSPKSKSPSVILTALVLGLAGCSGVPQSLTPANAALPIGTPGGVVCHAGAYTCRLPIPGPLGAPCSCPGLGAPSFGTIG